MSFMTFRTTARKVWLPTLYVRKQILELREAQLKVKMTSLGFCGCTLESVAVSHN